MSDMYDLEWGKYKNLMQEYEEFYKDSQQMPIEKDREVIRQYELKTGKKIGIAYRSDYNVLVVDLIKKQDGTHYPYERILPAVKKGAVVVLPQHNGKLVLLKQYRHALRGYQYSFPRGYGEAQISSEENVKKEIMEELGGNAENITYLGMVSADSGLTGSRASVYFCTIDEIQIEVGYEGIEAIVELDVDELKQWIAQGKIDDGFTLSALCLYQNGKNDITKQ
jgi:ADP-ribose pyrophosphatase